MSALSLDAGAAAALERCVREGGVAVFPADTVYGVCCDPDDAPAARRIYEVKGRPPERPSAVMFFALEPALLTLAELHSEEQRAMRALLPGPVTLLLPNRAARFKPACGPDPHTLGLRVPALEGPLSPLSSVGVPVMQSSANLSAGPDARNLSEVPQQLLDGVDLVLDGGALPGTPSTVLDLRAFAVDGTWRIVREGPISADEVRDRLAVGAA